MKTAELKTEAKVKLKCLYNSNAALTHGKDYEVISEEENKVFIIDDNGKKNSFYKSRFEDNGII